MKDLKEFNFESKVLEMVDGFMGCQDSEAICNLNISGRTVQVMISLVDEDESDFSDYEGVPIIGI